jgi:hypothetical protein
MFDKATGIRDHSMAAGVISVTHPPAKLKKLPGYSQHVNDVEGSWKVSKSKVLEALHPPRVHRDRLAVTEQR